MKISVQGWHEEQLKQVAEELGTTPTQLIKKLIETTKK